MVNTDLQPGGGRKLPKHVSSLAKTTARTFDQHFFVPLEVNVLQWIVEQIGLEGRFGENLRGFDHQPADHSPTIPTCFDYSQRKSTTKDEGRHECKLFLKKRGGG